MFFKRNFNSVPQPFAKRKRKRLKFARNSAINCLLNSLSSSNKTGDRNSPLADQPIFFSDYNDHPDSFFKSTKPIVKLSQFFGILIVHGITGNNFTSVHFKYKSWKIIYVMALITGNSFILACSFAENVRSGFTFERSAALIFFTMGLVTTVIFLWIAKQWPEVCKEFAIVEKKFESYGYPARTGLKLKCITFLLLMGALVENMLSCLSSYQASFTTDVLKDKGNISMVQRFFLQHFHQIFYLFEFAYWKAIIVFHSNIVSTFWWNFADLFLIIMSISITFKIQLFNKTMFQNVGKVLITFLLLMGALVENMLSCLSSYQASFTTDVLKDKGNISMVQRFFLQHFHQIFYLFEFAYWKAIIVFHSNIVSTFWWNFADLFLIIMSISITFKIQLFNKTMFQNVGKIKPSSFWNKAREDYNYLSLLTKKVDKCIGLLMLVSFGSNLYFVCTTLFKNLRNDRRTYEGVLAIYFNWSFGFLIFRTLSVALSAANLHDASKEIKTVLYSIPKQGFTAEAERLLIQISTDDIVLTGWGFFSLTKKFLLQIAGTIMTYEIFLIQLIP